METLLLITPPARAAQLLAARHPGFALARCASIPVGLGLVLPLLARTPPFSRAPLGLRVPLTAGEIARVHHLLVLQHRRPAAYAGWATCTMEQGARFLGPEGIRALDEHPGDDTAMAFLTWIATSAEAMTVLKTAMRSLYPGRSYFARRSWAATARNGVTKVVRRGGTITPLVIPQTQEKA